MLVREDKAWDYAVGMIKVDGLEPSPEMKELIEREKRGEITMEGIKEELDKKYKLRHMCRGQKNNSQHSGYLWADVVYYNDRQEAVYEEKLRILLEYLNQIDYTMVMVDEDTIELAGKFIDFGILRQKSLDIQGTIREYKDLKHT